MTPINIKAKYAVNFNMSNNYILFKKKRYSETRVL